MKWVLPSNNNTEKLVTTAEVLSKSCCFNQAGDCPRVARWMKRARGERRAFCADASLANEPEILPVSLEILSRLPRAHSSRGSLIAAVLAAHLEEQFMSIEKSIPMSNGHGHSAALSDREIAAYEARNRLARLMPFHRWCTALDPTDAAKELYLFVRARLKMRVTESLKSATATARIRVKRPRASKSRSAALLKDPAAEQRLG
jgi:hypothetical protein